ncbi:MAG: hypothetical protein PWR30_33 [Candidatus Woesearchaeota archaeon]|nr:hypothetical protein [Candidatus Woesearchaeota archaeon]
MVSDKLLARYGFVSDKYKSIYKEKLAEGIKSWEKFLDENSDKLSEIADTEEIEIQRGVFAKSGYPKPNIPTLRITHESFSQSIEEIYYWFMRSMQIDFSLPFTKKTIDSFAASEHSAFFGVASQRLGIQQDKVSQFLASIGKMVKDMFQIVRELRIIDERLELYKESKEGKEASDVTLKGIWIDMVEGGSKNPASVYGMAQQVGFAVLPDLFFSTFVGENDDVDEIVDKMEFNDHLKRVLKRKLKSYVTWRKNTEKELSARRKFTIQYLYQHYNTIKLYMDWVRPYLRNIKRLSSNLEKMDSADIVSAFDTSIVEIETIAYNKVKGYNACALLHFYYRTKPTMSFQEEGFQRGPLHIGSVEVSLRGYVWDDKQLENYINMRREEDFEILGALNETISKAMDELGGDVKKYIEEAEGANKESTKEEKEQKKGSSGIGNPFEPFTELFKGFGTILSPIKNADPFKGINKNFEKEKEKDKWKSALKAVSVPIGKSYLIFKKTHGMVHW